MHKRLFGLLASGAIIVAACGGAHAVDGPLGHDREQRPAIRLDVRRRRRPSRR